MATKENFVHVTIDATVSIGASSIVVDAGISPFNTPIDPSGETATLVLLDDPDTPTKLEIVTYTGRTGSGPYTLTGVSKGEEGTSDQSWAAGDHVIQAPTVASAGGNTIEGDLTVNNGDVLVTQDGVAIQSIQSFGTGATDRGVFAFRRARGTQVSPAGINSGDVLGTWFFNGTADSVPTWGAGARIEAITTQDWTGSARGTKLTFSTVADGTTTLTAHMTINHDGNIGIGNSSLQAWSSIYTAMQLGGNCSFFATTAEGAGTTNAYINNAYFDGTWKYVSTDEVSSYTQVNGEHRFYSAASGTADTAISWNNGMRFGVAGHLSIGKATFEAWDSSYTALQLGGTTALMGTTSEAVSTVSCFMNNAYYDGAWKYLVTDEATRYQVGNGEHYFSMAASGTADTTITWTHALIVAIDGITTTLKSYGETKEAKGSVSGAQTLNTANGNLFSVTATGAITFTFTTAFTTVGITLKLTNGGTNITWPTSVDWAGGTAPTLTTTGVDILTFITDDGGTTWYGFLAGANFS